MRSVPAPGLPEDLVSIPVQDPVSQGLEHSCASVVGGASADAHDESAAAFLDSGPDHLADPKGGGFHRILFCIRNQGDPGGSRHFNDSRAAFRKDAILAVHRPSHGTGDGYCFQGASHAAGRASTVPSPPSAKGRTFTAASLYTRRIPSSMAWPAPGKRGCPSGNQWQW